MKKINLILISVVALLQINCTKVVIDESDTSELPPLADTVYYDPTIANIMSSNCVGCHSGSNPSSGVDLTNYSNVKFQTESGDLINRMNDPLNPMPPAGLVPAADRQKIDKWLEDGFKEN